MTNKAYHGMSLSNWLREKHNIAYSTYKRKSKEKKDEFRKEYEKDTGIHIQTDKQKVQTYNGYWMNYLSEIGVPLAPDGTPLGIGWD